MAVERTLILAKPDALARNLAGEILARFERRGMRLRAARLHLMKRLERVILSLADISEIVPQAE